MLAAWFSDLGPRGLSANQGPRTKLKGRRRLHGGPWTLAFVAPMKLPTIFSALLSNKGRSQGAGGPFRGDGLRFKALWLGLKGSSNPPAGHTGAGSNQFQVPRS